VTWSRGDGGLGRGVRAVEGVADLDVVLLGAQGEVGFIHEHVGVGLDQRRGRDVGLAGDVDEEDGVDLVGGLLWEEDDDVRAAPGEGEGGVAHIGRSMAMIGSLKRPGRTRRRSLG